MEFLLGARARDKERKKKEVSRFDSGEWTRLINPADGMGWDVIIAPGSSKTSQNLKPVGHVEYADGSGNDKMIIASGGSISSSSKEIINKFFEEQGDSFKEIEWY